MTRFYSIRFRLTATFLVIILAVMAIISFFLYSMLERFYMNNFLEGLERSGFFASEFVVGHLRGQVDAVRLSALADNMSRQSQARVIFTDQQGLVVGDSLRIGGLLNQRLDHEDVRAALNGSVSSSISYSERIQYEVVQIAVPVKEEDGIITGVVFLSASLEDVNRILEEIRRLLFLSTVLAMAVVGSGSIILARRFTRPLEELTIAAGKMAEGKLDQHIEFSSEDELGRLAEQFNLMAKRLNYYTGNLKKFAADVAHEVRTPLTTMGLLTNALKDHEMEPEQSKEFIDDLDSEVERLTAMVNDLLELSKLEKNNIEREEINLNLFLQDIIGENQYRFIRASVDLYDDISEEIYKVYVAPSQLRQVIGNLLDNALNYTRAGGEVSISLYGKETDAVVRVKDTGCGIPEEDLGHIFERFFRVDRARSREGGGTGLGLAIVSEIVAKYDGKVWVESEEGVGSSFYFALPLVNGANVNNP